jgi:hypothetical protein
VSNLLHRDANREICDHQCVHHVNCDLNEFSRSSCHQFR